MNSPPTYQILEIPGGGAQGAVCLVQSLDGTQIGIKVLRSNQRDNADLVARARDEGRVLMRLDHPNLVKVFAVEEFAGRPLLRMEWVDGVSAKRLLREQQVIPVPVVVEAMRAVADGLAYAWGARDASGDPLRVVHRDLKPDNVIFTVDGQVKLVDFGLARAEFDERESVTLVSIRGTQGYMAPEFLSGSASGAGLDSYALGVMLFELLSGVLPVVSLHPYRHDEDMADQLQHLANELEARDTDPTVIVELTNLIRRLCAYQMQGRPDHEQVAWMLSDLQVRQDWSGGLSQFVEDVVRPLRRSRTLVPPIDHPMYSELRFLETGESITPMGVNRQSDRAERQIRAFLAKPRWEERTKELRWLLARNVGWTPDPLIEILDLYLAPWWRFYLSRPSESQVVALLKLLRYRRTPEVEKRARMLVTHRSTAVANAAKAVLDRG